MLYRLLADATAAAHFVFVAYVVVGGFIAWRWPRSIWLHLIAFGWGFGTVLFRLDCPLTHLENWARHRAGQAGLPPSGFIDHYITGVIYPESALVTVRVLVAVGVLVSWVGYGWLRRRAAGSATRLQPSH
ncbi:DUF2784 domain-containing protein [Nocardia iowensis]|uniref:DUF2784 domain-containing protein n=1 Tax=Nocardia iowensis TaxID=204891 RepID=A0ABX8S3B6_NOCIO|nr:DUF2784 domain-containing protein [Nocardia iowensis]QXN95150.1 DUF2784 domain-containing protein [Nocardia iowensis]